MFSGIIKGTGVIRESVVRGGDRRITIDTSGVELGRVEPGDSIAVNGVCLTALDPGPDGFAADVSAETLDRTTLGSLAAGASVNLESSLRVGDTIDGHLVYGHVDAVGKVVEMATAARSVLLSVEIPAPLARYIARKGSVTIDGVSLTVNTVTGSRFSVNIIPHTRDITIISGYGTGTPVNIEVDTIARYVERLLSTGTEPLTRDTLKRHGFIESD